MPPPSPTPREPIVGPKDPEPPFPLKLKGKVIKGFGRGSKEVCQPSPPTCVIFPLPMRQLRSPLPLSPFATRVPGSGTPCMLPYLKLPLPLRTHLQLKAAPPPPTGATNPNASPCPTVPRPRTLSSKRANNIANARPLRTSSSASQPPTSPSRASASAATPPSPRGSTSAGRASTSRPRPPLCPPTAPPHAGPQPT